MERSGRGGAWARILVTEMHSDSCKHLLKYNFKKGKDMKEIMMSHGFKKTLERSFHLPLSL